MDDFFSDWTVASKIAETVSLRFRGAGGGCWRPFHVSRASMISSAFLTFMRRVFVAKEV